jgi:hypothetical protein
MDTPRGSVGEARIIQPMDIEVIVAIYRRGVRARPSALRPHFGHRVSPDGGSKVDNAVDSRGCSFAPISLKNSSRFWLPS